MSSLKRTRGIDTNDLRANEGRETKALNFKPNTNLKEISELSNYSKTSGFRLHAVSISARHNQHQNIRLLKLLARAGFGGVSRMNVIN